MNLSFIACVALAALFGIAPPIISATALQDAPKPTAPADSTKVFITAKGKKYHKQTCKHIANGASEITLGEAKKRGLSACSDCGGA